jgi:hypothetical protein
MCASAPSVTTLKETQTSGTRFRYLAISHAAAAPCPAAFAIVGHLGEHTSPAANTPATAVAPPGPTRT